MSKIADCTLFPAGTRIHLPQTSQSIRHCTLLSCTFLSCRDALHFLGEWPSGLQVLVLEQLMRQAAARALGSCTAGAVLLAGGGSGAAGHGRMARLGAWPVRSGSRRDYAPPPSPGNRLIGKEPISAIRPCISMGSEGRTGRLAASRQSLPCLPCSGSMGDWLCKPRKWRSRAIPPPINPGNLEPDARKHLGVKNVMWQAAKSPSRLLHKSGRVPPCCDLRPLPDRVPHPRP